MCLSFGLNRTLRKRAGRLAAVSPASLTSTGGESMTVVCTARTSKNERTRTHDPRHSLACRQVALDRGIGTDLFRRGDLRGALQSAEHVFELCGHSRWPRDRPRAGI